MLIRCEKNSVPTATVDSLLMPEVTSKLISLLEQKASPFEPASLAKIEHDVEQFLDRIAHATVPSVIATYESRIQQLEERRIELSEKIANCGRPLRSFDETLRTSLAFLANPCNLWASERPEDKKKVLKLAFADRLAYVRNEGFRTPDLALPFKVVSRYGAVQK
jgi:hypothetical protein